MKFATWNINECVGITCDLNDQKTIDTINMNNINEIIDKINTYDFDVICFQEYPTYINDKISLTNKNLQDIIDNTRNILSKAIKLGGTTIHTYTSVNGITGLFQQELLVHGKKDMPCSICKTKIIKTTVGTRGTCYCPHCQKKVVLCMLT